jgi:Dolichyl-phosphate-mannose-protein mannosyltransferase
MESKTVPATLAQNARRWLVLACILAVYIHNVERWHSAVYFGWPHDDGIYFSTAKALAQGQGYRLISFPDSPPQTEYPILYPYLLSWVWQFNPNFPDNLKPAIRLTEFFGCWSLIAALLLLRRFGIGEPAALFLVALLAFEPAFLHLSGWIMSDVPFMALLLTTLLLADAATRSRAAAPLVLATGAIAGLSVGLRIVGVAVVAGIFFVALRRRAFREAFLLAAAAGTVVAIESWSRLVHLFAAATPVTASTAEPGWNQVLAYYTDYVGYGWRMGIPSAWALVRFLETNIAALALSAGSVVLGVDGGHVGATALLSVLVWLGIVRQMRRPEWQATVYVLILYCCIVVSWLPLPERFLVPFIPVFFVALWLEMSRLWALCRANLRSGVPWLQRALAIALACILLYVLGFTAWNYLVGDPRDLQQNSAVRAHALEEKKQAYQWIRDHTGPNDRIAAWEDGLMYLYTGRQGLRPFEPLPQDSYMDDQESLRRDLAHMCDAPRHARVRFWLISDDDFSVRSGVARIDARMAEIAAVLPVVFRSGENHVQIHDASCLTDLDRADCRAAAPILFPDSVSKVSAPSQVNQ